MENKKLWLFFCISGCLLLAENLSGQAKEEACSCSQLVHSAVQKVSSVYAGFFDKVTDTTREAYELLVKQVTARAAKEHTDRGCYEILRMYTAWFKDEHVGVWYKIQALPATIPVFPVREISRRLSLATDSLEGLWSTWDQKEQYAILQDPSGKNQYIAVIMKTPDSLWKPGMVKAEFFYYEPKPHFFRAMFYSRDFTGFLDGFTHKGNRIDHWFGPSWYKWSSGKQLEQEVQVRGEQFKIINKNFVYLKLARFNEEDVNRLDSLIRVNRHVIYNTPNLIIDLRGNPGGNASASQEMIQLIYTNPIIYPAWQYRSSPELIRSTEEQISELKKNDPYRRLKAEQGLLQRLMEHPGQLVSSGDSIVRTVDSVARYPQRVAFLVDEGSGSSAEFFAFEGKQSRKVTLFGSHTAGVMDYGNAHSFPLPCGSFTISIPFGRNGWIERFGYRIDSIGFQPDVPIPPTEKDWIRFVIDYWSKK